MPVARRTHRTEARLLPERKKRIERGAAVKGISTSDFIVQNADEAAIRTIEQHESWTLSNRDRDFLLEILTNPPRPGTRLNTAMGRTVDEHFGG